MSSGNILCTFPPNMALKQDQERVKMLIQDTITLLCKNGLNYKNEFEIKALIGITIDKSDVILMDINRNIEQCPTKGKQSTQQKEQEDAASSNTHEPSYSVRKAHKKRKRGVADNSGSKNTSGLIPDRDKDMNPAERGLSKDDLPARREYEDDHPAAKTAKTTYDGHSVIAVKTEPTKTEPESDDNDDAADYSGWDETTEPEPGELSASEIRESQLEELSLSEIQSGELEEEDSPKTKQKENALTVLKTRLDCKSLESRIEYDMQTLNSIKYYIKNGRHAPGFSKNVKDNVQKQSKRYVYRAETDTMYTKLKNKLVEVVMTKEKKQEVFDKAHHGHIGLFGTMAKIDKIAYWKFKREEVRKMVEDCEACKVRRDERKKAEIQRQHLMTKLIPLKSQEEEAKLHSQNETVPNPSNESNLSSQNEAVPHPSNDSNLHSQNESNLHPLDNENHHPQDDVNLGFENLPSATDFEWQ